jgi:hypothetical protein
MKDKLILGLTVAVAVFVGVLGLRLIPGTQTGGDYAGGIQPSNLFTGNVTTNSVTPNLSNLFLNGSISVGGQAANNQIPVVYTATTAYPASSNVLRGPLVSSTSTATTSVAFTSSGFSVGDACEVTYNGAGTSTNALGADAFVTAVSGSNVTATVTFWNGASGVTTFTVTSTVTGVSSSLKATCFHTGV